MNFKMKALVAAAVAVMGVSGVASAAMVDGKTGSSSLVLTIIDASNNVSAAFDLGFDYAGFSVGGASSASSFSWNLASGDYADAWNAITSSGSSLSWAIGATDYVGSISEAGSMGFITTFREGQTLPDSLRMAQFGAPQAQFDRYINANNALGNHGSVENGASIGGGALNSYGGQFYVGNKFYGIGPLVTGAIGDELGVVQYYSAVGSLGKLTFAEYDASFKLDANGVLTYAVAAVPEPETYALLLAGLGLVGAAARRRKAA
ncbi:hypothetical protein LG202_24260 [Methylobacillus methanolivorans]